MDNIINNDSRSVSEEKNPKMSDIVNMIKSMNYRPEWDEYFMIAAYLISRRSTSKKLQVGCIIVRDNRVVVTGYNGHLPGANHDDSIIRDGHEMLTVHAEVNAICDAAKKGIELSGSTAYVTHYTCINCCKTLLASGIKCVYYAEDYKNDPLAEKLFAQSNVVVKKIDL